MYLIETLYSQHMKHYKMVTDSITLVTKNQSAFFFPFPFGFAEAPSLGKGDEDPALVTTMATIPQQTEPTPTTKRITIYNTQNPNSIKKNNKLKNNQNMKQTQISETR